MGDKKETKQELMVQESAALAEQRPAFIEVGNKEGAEHITRQDIQMPRIGLAQQMSPELVEGDPKYIQDLKIGMMFNTLDQKIYGVGPLHFCVVRADPPRWVEFIPRDLGGGVRDPNVPRDDPRTEFGPNGEVPVATKFYDFVIMLLPSRELVALSFKSTGLKTAKQLNGLIAMRNAPLYQGKYQLMTTMTQNSKGRFAIFQIRNDGWIPDLATNAFAKEAFDNLRDKIIHIDRDDPDTFDVEAMERESGTSGVESK